MAILNTQRTLNVHSPKKDTALTTGVNQTIGADEVAIFLPAYGLDRPQLYVSALINLRDFGLTNMAAGWTSVSVSGGFPPESSIALDAADEPLTTLYLIVGANVRDRQQTHFLDRTFKRLIENLLEDLANGLS